MDTPDELIPNEEETLTARRRELKRATWVAKWSEPGFAPPWLGRGALDEIVAAVQNHWFVPGSHALDIGCGEGNASAWLVEQGFPTVGLDIASTAIARARKRHEGVTGGLEFLELDICSASPPDRQYSVIIDQGCLHAISPEDRLAYVQNVVKVAAPGARMLLFMKAFRNGIPVGHPAEKRRVIADVERTFGSHFASISNAVTYLDPQRGKQRQRALPGMVFWLVRRS